jgi:hypothetical protein
MPWPKFDKPEHNTDVRIILDTPGPLPEGTKITIEKATASLTPKWRRVAGMLGMLSIYQFNLWGYSGAAGDQLQGASGVAAAAAAWAYARAFVRMEGGAAHGVRRVTRAMAIGGVLGMTTLFHDSPNWSIWREGATAAVAGTIGFVSALTAPNPEPTTYVQVTRAIEGGGRGPLSFTPPLPTPEQAN